ncbi:hypothetical protein CCR75_006760 [Bremia lactucae]|uniref:Uncharacterized protein n=1 Tax=Bremia lactucae TaxID=4779 RepID=A0A976FFH4_BRELC|nr:hypothetical protein CCR75_006760 [Bremia lactucae]
MLTNGYWQNLWQSWSETWVAATGVLFLTLDSSPEQWCRAVLAEPVQLMRLLQQLPFQHTLLNALSDEVIVAWMAAWRQDCLYLGLMAYPNRKTDHPTQVWLDEGKARMTSVSGNARIPGVQCSASQDLLLQSGPNVLLTRKCLSQTIEEELRLAQTIRQDLRLNGLFYDGNSSVLERAK